MSETLEPKSASSTVPRRLSDFRIKQGLFKLLSPRIVNGLFWGDSKDAPPVNAEEVQRVLDAETNERVILRIMTDRNFAEQCARGVLTPDDIRLPDLTAKSFILNGPILRIIEERCYRCSPKKIRISVCPSGVQGDDTMVKLQIEIEPPPTKENLDLCLNLCNGESRQFTLDVPPEVKRGCSEEEVRPRTRSDYCEPIIATVLDFNYAEWNDEQYPLSLSLVQQ